MSKGLVEESLKLSIFKLKEFGVLKRDYLYEGTLSWSSDGKEFATIGYLYNPFNLSLRLKYRWKYNWDIEYTHFDYIVKLERTPCNLGGYRLWFKCPHCNKRSGCLYKLNQSIFICRECHNLVYQSQNENKLYRCMKSCFEIEEVYKKLYSLRTRSYNGKPTRRAKYLQDKAERLEQNNVYSMEEILRRL